MLGDYKPIDIPKNYKQLGFLKLIYVFLVCIKLTA